MDPLRNTVPSLKTLGEVLNRPEKLPLYCVLSAAYGRDPQPSGYAQSASPQSFAAVTSREKQNAARLQLPEIWPIYWPFPAGITLQQGSSVVFSDGSARQVLSDNPEYYLVTGSGGRDNRGSYNWGRISALTPPAKPAGTITERSGDCRTACCPGRTDRRTLASCLSQPVASAGSGVFARELHRISFLMLIRRRH